MTTTQTISRTITFFNPPDVDTQHELWGANCGPTALAALLGKTVASIQPYVKVSHGGNWEKKRIHMHAGHLTNVLIAHAIMPVRRDFERGAGKWPHHGLAVIQIDGPWCNPDVPRNVRFRHTHTVAVAANGGYIYDGNARAWLVRPVWERQVMADLVADVKRATGWYITTTLEIEP